MITKDDRVSAVLRQDESLIDVFTELSPAFERLRNPAMRKVMSRLVTVEQAARMAGVDADTLVRRLNHGRVDSGSASAGQQMTAGTITKETTAGTTASETTRTTTSGGSASARPAGLAAIPAERVVSIDVRDDLRRGQEPFSRIMAAKASVPDGGALGVRAIFEPVPLYAVLAKQGFTHHTERLADDDWQVWFYPAGASAAPSALTARPVVSEEQAEADVADDVLVLDVRGLEPPEPMMRTLAALEGLADGATLVQLNVRVPQFLLPLLDERGFAHEVREQEPGLVRVFIRRNCR